MYINFGFLCWMNDSYVHICNNPFPHTQVFQCEHVCNFFSPAQDYKGGFTWGPNSKLPLMLASLNIEARSQLLSLKKPLKYGQISLKLDLDYLMPKYHRASIETWVWFFAQQNSQDKSQASPSKNVAM